MGTTPAGFTLLELIIVLAIGAAVYAVILLGPVHGASSADLKAAARVRSPRACARRRASAMATRRDALLTLDVEAREFIAHGRRASRASSPTTSTSSSTRRKPKSRASARGSIRFYPDGSSTGGRITVASGERKYLVDVDWLTGRVSIGD